MDTINKNPVLESKLTSIKQDILKDVDVHLSSAIDHLLSVVERTSVVDGKENAAIPSKKQDRSKRDSLPDREFFLRNSVLTDMWAVPHLASVFNICTAMFLLCIMMSTLFYATDSKALMGDLELLFWAGGKIYSWLSIWMGMTLSCLLLLFPGYAIWASKRNHSPKITSFDCFFLTLYLTYLGLFLYVPVKLLLLTQLPPMSSIIVILEQTRMFMKIYAFVRENIPKTLKFKPHQDGDESQDRSYPEFQKFLYFLFIPTLVYRDNYPRTLKIRWDNVFWNFLQIFASILAVFIGFQRYIIPIFQNVNHHYITPNNLVIVLSGSVLFGTLALFCGFYGFLHCWMNAFAEMLRYGDRLFYEDWWNGTTFSQFYRRWNRVVHDWIYAYAYRDLLWLFGKNQNLVLVVVLFSSAFIHEVIIALSLRFVLPIMFFYFSVPGVIVQFATRNKSSAPYNVFMWMSIMFGWGSMIFLYSIEWYARKNCPRVIESSWDYFVPRVYTCDILNIG